MIVVCQGFPGAFLANVDINEIVVSTGTSCITIASFGICQGMSWQHVNQPWGWIGVILLSLLHHLHQPCVAGQV